MAVPSPSKASGIETKVLVDAKGDIHVLWAVPGPSGSSGATGIWYARYNPNGTYSIPPTIVRNSSIVQSADMAVDRLGVPHLVWAEGTAFANASAGNMVLGKESGIYYLELNLTGSQRLFPRTLTNPKDFAAWPSIVVDRNLTSHVVWTQIDGQAATAGIYYGFVEAGGILNRTLLVAKYNQTIVPIGRPGIALDGGMGGVHIVWGESDMLANKTIVSTVRYARFDPTGRSIGHLEVAQFADQLGDLSVTSGPNDNAYLLWETKGNNSNSPNPLYVSRVSGNGQVVFLSRLSEHISQDAYLSLSADSQENFYVVWYQPPPSPVQHLPRNSTLTNITYLRLDQEGASSLAGNDSVPGPIIAVTVSESGDIVAVSNQGIVKVNRPTGSNTALIGALVLALTVISATSMTEEGRYSVVRQMGPLARKFSDNDPRTLSTRYQSVLGVLSRRPGMRTRDFKRSPDVHATLSGLALLENAGYISSIRDGTVRRFYSKMQTVPNQENIGTASDLPMVTRVLHEIERNPGIWEAKLSESLGLSQQIVHYHLKRLQRSKLITSETHEKRKLYRVSHSKPSNHEAF
jgi:DNA-binding transcriptional ArsR family regulator